MVGDQFADPDLEDSLTFIVRSTHSNVVVRRTTGDCSITSCTVYVDFDREPPNVTTFDIIVQAKDKSGLLSPTRIFPFGVQAPADQTYILSQYGSNNNLSPLTVGLRLAVDHTLKLLKTDTLEFLGDEKNYAKLKATGTADLSAGTITRDNWEFSIGSATKTDGTTVQNSRHLNVSVVEAKGAVKADSLSLEIGADSAAILENKKLFVARPGTDTTDEAQLTFQVSRIGVGHIVFTEYVWWDSDGDGEEAVAKWHKVASKSLRVNVRSIPR